MDEKKSCPNAEGRTLRANGDKLSAWIYANAVPEKIAIRISILRKVLVVRAAKLVADNSHVVDYSRFRNGNDT
jgi:hypothetical protein